MLTLKNGKSIKAVLLSLLILVACLCLASCGAGKDDSNIYIIPSDKFEGAVELDENGAIEKISKKKLKNADVETVIAGQEYYAVLYVGGKRVKDGSVEFANKVTLSDKDIYVGTKKGYKINYKIREYENKEIEITPYELKKTDYYIAVKFKTDKVDAEEFTVSFDCYQTNVFGRIKADKYYENVTKKLCYKKQITSETSVKYLSYGDYLSGEYDDKLKDSIEAPIGEKFFAVIDYKLSSFKDIEETDTVTVSISAKSEYMPYLTLGVEEIPTSDYEIKNNTVKATFKLKDGGEAGKTYRFIVFIRASDRGNINISSEISGKQISFFGDKTVASIATVSEYQSATSESQLEFVLSADGTYYTVAGIGNELLGVIAIPSYHENKPVKAISDNAFSNISYITEVYLPGTLETIGANAFSYCTSLERIAIPSSVKAIGSYAFAGCNKIFIYCEAEEKPSGWSDVWNINQSVSWGYGKK